MTTIIFLNFFTWIHQSCSQIIWFKKTENILDFVFSLIEKFWLDWFFFLFTVRACGTYYIGYFIRSRNLETSIWINDENLHLNVKKIFNFNHNFMEKPIHFNCSILRFLRLFSSWRILRHQIPKNELFGRRNATSS